MEIVEIPEHGFCFGVKRSIDIANKVIEDAKGPVYTFGPIIHNAQVVEKLRKRGVVPIDSFEGKQPGTLIIRSHGVAPLRVKEASDRGFDIVDATCPFVKRAQKHARKLCEEGYDVVIIGEREHPEIQGILGYTGNRAEVVNDIESLAKFRGKKKVGVVAQTTISIQGFKDMVSCLSANVDEIRVFNTICKDVISRQEHTAQIADRVEVMIVVGGKNSANTRRLVALAQSCVTHHIETAEEIDGDWLKGKSVIGVTAGASTPGWIIDDVRTRIGLLNGGKNGERG
jgi:4-hydroxy-3-methylbut-2-enyl diphosphate reductase